jgi:hypothetical protein
MPPGAPPRPVFRWEGQYWGFVAGEELYDRYGRHVGWLEGTDVYARSGAFLGELRGAGYVLRDLLRPEPVYRAARPAVPYATPPAPPPDRDARDPVDDWRDALPWPLPPPEPPRV